MVAVILSLVFIICFLGILILINSVESSDITDVLLPLSSEIEDNLDNIVVDINGEEKSIKRVRVSQDKLYIVL